MSTYDGYRAAVSEYSLREQESRLVTREERTPRAKLELPPARSMTLSGLRPKIRSGLGGLRSSSAMSVDREEEPSRGIRHVGGGSVRIKKSSELSIGLILSVSVCM